MKHLSYKGKLFELRQINLNEHYPVDNPVLYHVNTNGRIVFYEIFYNLFHEKTDNASKEIASEAALYFQKKEMRTYKIRSLKNNPDVVAFRFQGEYYTINQYHQLMRYKNFEELVKTVIPKTKTGPDLIDPEEIFNIYE